MQSKECVTCGLRIEFCKQCQGHISIYCSIHIMDNIQKYFSHNIRCWHTSMYNMCFCDDNNNIHCNDNNDIQCPTCVLDSKPFDYEEADVSPRYFSNYICQDAVQCDDCKLIKPVYTCELCHGQYCLDCRKQITFDISPVLLYGGWADAVLREILICLPCREARTVRSIRNIYRKKSL